MTMSVATKSSSGGSAVLLAAIALGGCGELKPNDPQDAGQLRAEAKRQKAVCASSVAYNRLKTIVFDQALSRYEGDRANLDTLADYSTARMENPIVEGRGAALDITRCKGRFILDVPPGAERAFAGQRSLQADVDYSAQAAADGNGLVYRLRGAEPIVTKLAAFNLTSVAFRPPPAIDERPGVTEVPMESAQADVPEQLPRAPEDRPEPVAEETVRQADRRPRRPTERAAEQAARAPEPTLPDSASSDGGEGTVRAFYTALGAGNGVGASAQVIPEKRSRGAFSPAAMTRFYGGLAEPIRVVEVVPMAGGKYRVRYRYSAGRSRCDGSAVVSVTQRDGRDYIRSIRALNGC